MKRSRHSQERREWFAVPHRIALYFRAEEPELVLRTYPEIRGVLLQLTKGDERQVKSGTAYLGRLLEEELSRWMPHQQGYRFFGCSDGFELTCSMAAETIQQAALWGDVYRRTQHDGIVLRADRRQGARQQFIVGHAEEIKALARLTARWDPWDCRELTSYGIIPELLWGLQRVQSEQETLELVYRLFPDCVAWTISGRHARLAGLARDAWEWLAELVLGSAVEPGCRADKSR